jgi:hypothetical protein
MNKFSIHLKRKAFLGVSTLTYYCISRHFVEIAWIIFYINLKISVSVTFLSIFFSIWLYVSIYGIYFRLWRFCSISMWNYASPELKMLCWSWSKRKVKKVTKNVWTPVELNRDCIKIDDNYFEDRIVWM